MRINERALRSIIREAILRESSITQRAADTGLAICVVGSPKSSGHLIIYDPNVVKSRVMTSSEASRPVGPEAVLNATLKDPIVKAGIAWNDANDIWAGPDFPGGVGHCNGVKVVSTSASVTGSGLGPVAYECAMWLTGGLTPDRLGISPSAGRVWNRFMKRPDVDHEPFDDIKYPMTPPPDDDCIVYDNSAWDSSYKLRSAPLGLEMMMRRHEVCNRYCAEMGLENLEFYLLLLYEELFKNRYEPDDSRLV